MIEWFLHHPIALVALLVLAPILWIWATVGFVRDAFADLLELARWIIRKLS